MFILLICCFLLLIRDSLSATDGLDPDSLRVSTSTQKRVLGFWGPYLIANVVITVITLLNVIVFKLLELRDANSDSGLNSSSEKQLCRCFLLDEILSATKNFEKSLVIGKGGFGKVYKGVIDNGSCTVAIKRLNPLSKQGAPEFWAEIKMLSKFRHSHLVSLIGYCNQNNEMIIVYEFMLHGSLDYHLHNISKNKQSNILSWEQRLKICIGAARGLDYLHTGTAILKRVVHRDVKSSNILLDENWAAKISDFGLSRVGPVDQESTHVSTKNIQGTFGYMDPEYFFTRTITRKSDVYAFGVVLLEVLSERPAVDRSLLDENQWGLAGWGQRCINEGASHKLISLNIDCEILPNSLTEFVGIAGQCLHSRPDKRPTMSEVVAKLELALSLQLRTNELVDDNLLTTEWPYGSSENTVSFSDGAHETALNPSLTTTFQTSNSDNTRGKPSSNDSRGDDTNLPYKAGDVIDEMMPAVSGQNVTGNLKLFELAELKSATKNFTLDVLGEESFGYVYKGWVDETTLRPTKVGHGIPIVIKRLNRKSLWGPKEGLMEVEVLGKFGHPNLVKLLGYYHSVDDHEFLLVYEYLQNRSLDNILFFERKTKWFGILFAKAGKQLSWYMRLKIAIGTSRALTYLHEATDNIVIHRDVRAANILLDEDFNAKLLGFGFAKQHPQNYDALISTRVIGTHGYVAPEYLLTGHVSLKSDVYSFGVVLLELLTGLKAWDTKRQSGMQNLVEWAKAKPLLSKTRSVEMKLVDPRLGSSFPEKGASELVSLILKCLEPYPQLRPSMKKVLQSLEHIHSIKTEPGKAQADTAKSPWSWTR